MSPDDDIWYVMNCINQFIAFFDAHDGTRRIDEIIRHINDREEFSDSQCECAYLYSEVNELIRYVIARDGESFTSDIVRRINERDPFTQEELDSALDEHSEFDEVFNNGLGNESLPF